MQALSIDEVSDLLKRIKVDGKVSLFESDDCHPAFMTPDGWKIRVFDDCGEFDYIDFVEAPDGRRWQSYEGEESQRDRHGHHIHDVNESHPLFIEWMKESRRHWLYPDQIAALKLP